MALPSTIRVKLSSEAAESISITAVVVRDMPFRELVEYLLGVAGKDEARIRELLLRGNLVSGASRFRWTGWRVDPEGLRQLLATFPDADPSRRFDAAQCMRATLLGGRQPIEIARDAGARKGLFQRVSFWGALMDVIGAGTPAYAGYSYKERSDLYRREFARDELEQIRSLGGLLRYTALSEQVRTQPFTHADLHVTREA